MGINPKFIEISRKLRRDQTPWEKKIWMYLKGRNFLGLKFKRQVVIGNYIYDFVCFEKKLIIELDGSQHKMQKIEMKDADKEDYAKNLQYRILRYNNSDVDANIEAVLESIRLAI